jgi:hypothetical protein
MAAVLLINLIKSSAEHHLPGKLGCRAKQITVYRVLSPKYTIFVFFGNCFISVGISDYDPISELISSAAGRIYNALV